MDAVFSFAKGYFEKIAFPGSQRTHLYKNIEMLYCYSIAKQVGSQLVYWINQIFIGLPVH